MIRLDACVDPSAGSAHQPDLAAPVHEELDLWQRDVLVEGAKLLLLLREVAGSLWKVSQRPVTPFSAMFSAARSTVS